MEGAAHLAACREGGRAVRLERSSPLTAPQGDRVHELTDLCGARHASEKSVSPERLHDSSLTSERSTTLLEGEAKVAPCRVRSLWRLSDSESHPVRPSKQPAFAARESRLMLA